VETQAFYQILEAVVSGQNVLKSMDPPRIEKFPTDESPAAKRYAAPDRVLDFIDFLRAKGLNLTDDLYKTPRVTRQYVF